MLVISVKPGETTTITTPSGDLISVLLLRHRTRNDDLCLGITAPEEYSIIRETLREKLLGQLVEVSVYRVSSAQFKEELIAVRKARDALELYQTRYPDCGDLQANRVKAVERQCWYPMLEKCWLLGMVPPFFVEDVD